MDNIVEMCRTDLERRKLEFSGASPDTEKEVEHPQPGINPLDKLRESDKACICFARAFIANCEVLVMHLPFSHFHSRTKEATVMQSIAEHRDSRGYKMPMKTVHMRRPRTVFFSRNENDLEASYIADYAWTMPAKKGDPWTHGPNPNYDPEFVSKYLKDPSWAIRCKVNTLVTSGGATG